MIPPYSNYTYTYTYDVDEFEYNPEHSMAAIFYLDCDKNPAFNYFRPYPGLNLPPPNFFSIRSSSHGLLLCYDLYNSAYHIFNPFINPTASYRRIATPPREHKFDTPAVLDVTVTNSGGVGCPLLRHHLCCRRGTGQIHLRHLLLERRRVDRRHTGANRQTPQNHGKHRHRYRKRVSEPHELVMYNKMISGWRIFKAPTRLPRNATLQLGRMNEDDIALVASGGLSEVRIFVGLRSWKEVGVYKDKGGAVKLVRFMTDVPLFTTNRIMRLWSSCDGRIHSMPQWIRVPPSISNCVPYVTSSCVADQFKKVDYGDEDEDEEDGDEEGKDKDDGDEDGKDTDHGDGDDKEKDVEMIED